MGDQAYQNLPPPPPLNLPIGNKGVQEAPCKIIVNILKGGQLAILQPFYITLPIYIDVTIMKYDVSYSVWHLLLKNALKAELVFPTHFE